MNPTPEQCDSLEQPISKLDFVPKSPARHCSGKDCNGTVSAARHCWEFKQCSSAFLINQTLQKNRQIGLSKTYHLA